MPKSETQFKPPRSRDFDPDDRPRAHEWVRVSGIPVLAAKARPNRVGLVAAIVVGLAAIAAAVVFQRPQPAVVSAPTAVVTDYVLDAESEGTVYDGTTARLKLKGQLLAKGGTFDAQPTDRFELLGSNPGTAKVEWKKLRDDLYAFEATCAPPPDKKDVVANLDLEFAIADQKHSAAFSHQWTFKEAATEVEKTQTIKIKTEQRRPKATSKPPLAIKDTEIQGQTSPKPTSPAEERKRLEAEREAEFKRRSEEMEKTSMQNEARIRARQQQPKPPVEPPKANPAANTTGGANPNGF